MSNISSFIKLKIPLTDITSQAMVDIDKVGTWIQTEIAYLYANKSCRTTPSPPLPAPPTTVIFDEIISKISGTPYDDSDEIGYYIIEGLAKTFDTHQGLALSYLTTGSPPPPQPYVHTPLSSYVIIKPIVDAQIVNIFGAGQTLTGIVDLFLTALDDFLTFSYTVV